MNAPTPAKKATAKKAAAAKRTAAAKKATVAQKDKPAEMTGEQQAPAVIADQAKFLTVLGVNPDLAVLNSVRVEFSPQGVPHVFYQAMLPVTPMQLGMAFMASSGMLGQGAGGTSEPIEGTD